MHTSLKLPYFLRNIISNLKTPKNRQSRKVYQEKEEEKEEEEKVFTVLK